MAEIQEVFEDFSDNTKKLVKSKPFVVAAVVVAVIALYVAWKRDQTANQGGADATYSYTGYPIVSGGGGDEYSYSDNSSYYEDLIADLDSNYQASLDELNSGYQSSLGELQWQYETGMSDVLSQLEHSKGQTSSALEALEKQQDLAQMRANSELYNNITDRAMKDALHAENLSIAEKWGFTFNEGSGNYFDGNSVVYTTSQQQASIIEGKKSGSNSDYKGYEGEPVESVVFQNNVDYQNEINKAIMSGESASTIYYLNEQRNAKLKASGESVQQANTSYDPNVDYTTLIQKAKETGASQAVIDNLTAQRNAKIDANPELEKYR